MITRKHYVIDTNIMIAFFEEVFRHSPLFSPPPKLSERARNIMQEAIHSRTTGIRISIPVVVFFEIYDKWLGTEEFCRKFYYDVFHQLKETPNIEIRPIDQEILENLICVGTELDAHDLHDRLILSSAMALEARLMTADRTIIDYVEKTHALPEVFY